MMMRAFSVCICFLLICACSKDAEVASVPTNAPVTPLPLPPATSPVKDSSYHAPFTKGSWWLYEKIDTGTIYQTYTPIGKYQDTTQELVTVAGKVFLMPYLSPSNPFFDKVAATILQRKDLKTQATDTMYVWVTDSFRIQARSIPHFGTSYPFQNIALKNYYDTANVSTNVSITTPYNTFSQAVSVYYTYGYNNFQPTAQKYKVRFTYRDDIGLISITTYSTGSLPIPTSNVGDTRRYLISYKLMP